MACPSLRPLLPLLATLALACGPGSDTTTSSDSSTQVSSADASSTGTTGDPTTAPTTGSGTTTGDGETVDPPMTATSDPTATATSNGSSTTDPTDPTSDPTATTGDPACPDQLPQDGTPCDVEGQFCGGPCDDPCAFCNVTRCEGGTWMHLEVFPNDCLDCAGVCEFVVPAGCAGGPPDQATCVAGCEQNQAGECKLPFNKVLGCIGSMPSFTCDAEARPVVAGCEAQFDELYACG